jgi:hypothetical protein
MNLELKHIAPYLPDLAIINNREYEFIKSIDLIKLEVETLFRGHLYNTIKIIDIKPILYPLDLTKPIWFEGKEIVPIEYIENDKDIDWFADDDRLFEALCIYNPVDYDWIKNYTPNGLMEIFYRMKLDVDGLIPKNLAISVHDVDSEIYKSK